MANATPKSRIGIIGGMGPEATVLLMSRIITATQACDDADHIPMIVDNNPQVPSRIGALIDKRGDDPGPVIADMARRLESYGAQALAMPCNTAHHYADDIRAAVAIPLLDMVQLAVKKIRTLARPRARLGMLASPAVRTTGIFDKAMEGGGPELGYLADDGPLLDLIRHIKAHGGDSQARKAFVPICDALMASGADMLLVACSELSLICDALPDSVRYVDTIDVLADACVAFSTEAQTSSSQGFAA